MSSIDDPLLKELLAALKEDTQRMAEDLLSIITTNALVAIFALFLAVATFVRIVFYPPRFGPGPGPGLIETTLTFVLFALSVVSIYNLLRLRERYARLQALAEKLGRQPLPLSPDTKKEAEKRLTVLKMMEVFADKCAKSTLLNGPFGGDDRAFDRLLGPAGILTRTSLVTATMDGRVTYYGRTEAGKVYQQVLDTELNFLDPYTGGEVWKK